MPLYANAGFLPFLRNLLCSRSRMLKKVMCSRCSLRLAARTFTPAWLSESVGGR